MFDWLGPIGGIILVDLILSGDNALVIGAAASKLPRKQRWTAISLGGGSAIILRIVFAILVTFLLKLPLLQALGAAVLLVIASRLLLERGTQNEAEEKAREHPRAGKTVSKGLWNALLMILVADTTMSLDNILAVGALANGNWLALIAGLLISILLLLIGSALISELVNHLPWLLDLASFVLAWTAAHMFLQDIRLQPLLQPIPYIEIIVPAIAFAIVLVIELLTWRRLLRERAARKVM